ncbi:MAG TPA: cytochrome d ubiquinol oxidase subunit II [Bacteroidales bacterium]|nr:cytochrome d ubiquinol oxidase subunit II [Bacteroidales bacterium]
MTQLISYMFLQQYWWVIIAALAGILVFLMFVQGGQSMIFSLPSDEPERTMIVNALGRKWEFTFTTLVVFGGTFFASFPLFYATSFGGAYWLWTVILFCFIIQAVSYEYRMKAGNVVGKKTFEIFLLINGSAGPFLIGVAVGTFFTGADFSLDDMNKVQWHNTLRGLEALGNVRNLALGFAVLFLARVNGLLFLMNTVESEDLRNRASRRIIMNSIIFLVFFLFFIITLVLSDGVTTDTGTGLLTAESHKYLNSFLQMPFALLPFLAGVAGVLYGIAIAAFRKSIKGIWYSGAGTFLAVMALFLVAGFNETAFYPSVHDINSSLTIMNASSSQFTLKTMMFVSFTVPFIIAYITYAWNALTNKKITVDELDSAGHKY